MASLCKIVPKISRSCFKKELILTQERYYSRKKHGDFDPATWNGEVFVTEKNHMETPRFPGEYNGEPQLKGKIYDKKPFRMEVEAGKLYRWCACGNSHNQPFCDNTHRYDEGTSFKKTRQRIKPVLYKATETKTVYWCNCKQTNKPPFCDGSHKHPDIEETNTIFRN